MRYAAMSKRKWSLARAGLYGLVVQVIAIWLSDWYWGAHEWSQITFYLGSGVSAGMTVAIYALLPAPSTCVIVAWFHNFMLERAMKGSTYHITRNMDAQRAASASAFDRAPTIMFWSALAFSVYALAAPNAETISRFEQLLGTQPATQGAALEYPPHGAGIAASHGSQPGATGQTGGATVSGQSQSGPLAQSSTATDSGALPSDTVTQKGAVTISGTSPVTVSFPQAFAGMPNVTIVNTHGYPASVLPVVEHTTQRSFELRGVTGASTGVGYPDMEFEWIATGPSAK